MTEKPIMTITPFLGKICKYQDKEGHVMPRTHHKKLGKYGYEEKYNTFLVSVKKEFAFLCQYCTMTILADCIADLEKKGATKRQIHEWVQFESVGLEEMEK